MPRGTRTRARHVIEIIDENNNIIDRITSSTRKSRAERHLERTKRELAQSARIPLTARLLPVKVRA